MTSKKYLPSAELIHKSTTCARSAGTSDHRGEEEAFLIKIDSLYRKTQEIPYIAFPCRDSCYNSTDIAPKPPAENIEGHLRMQPHDKAHNLCSDQKPQSGSLCIQSLHTKLCLGHSISRMLPSTPRLRQVKAAGKERPSSSTSDEV